MFEEEKLSEHSDNSQNTLLKATSSVNFILFFALRTKQNRSKDVSVTYFQNIANMKQMTSALKNYRTSASNKLVSQGNWFRGKTGFAGKLVSRKNWFRRQTGFAGKLVSQAN